MASISKHLFFFLFLVIFDLFGFSQGRKLIEILDQEGSGGGSDASLKCMQKLIPCQPYLKTPEKAPAACCLPLKQLVSDDTKCLCNFFNNPDLLSRLNVSQDDALKLPEACKANADISMCKKDAASPSSSPPTPSAANNTSPGRSSKSAAAYATSPFGPSGSAALFMALIITVF